MYEFQDVDIIILEGIYLLKQAYRYHFNLSFWVEGTFETVLAWALQCGQNDER